MWKALPKFYPCAVKMLDLWTFARKISLTPLLVLLLGSTLAKNAAAQSFGERENEILLAPDSPTLNFELPPLGDPSEYLPEVPKPSPTLVDIPPQFRGQTIYRATVPNNEKVIALTFDDGPWPDSIPILDILRENDVKATFFWLGQNVPRYPEIVRRTIEEGHAIGNHTWNHRYPNMDAATAAAEVDNTAARIFEETGVRTVLFRPPGGYLNNGVAAHAKGKNYAVVMWSIDTKDYLQPAAATLANRVIQQAHPGAIVLMHDGGGSRRRTAEALPIIIQRLRQQGYRFVTVQELLAMEAGTLQLD